MLKILKKASNLVAQAREARNQSGPSVSRQLLELLRLFRSDRHIGPSDYYDFRLFSKNDYSTENPSDYVVGWRASKAFCDALNRPAWSIIADDKVCMYSMLRDAGIRVPVTQALYHPRGRTFMGASTLESISSIETFLRSEARYPIFGKPSLGCAAINVLAFQRYDASMDAVIDFADRGTPVSSVAKEIVAMAGSRQEWSYLFQEKLEPHPELRAITGNGISSFRVLVLAGRNGIEIARVVWKIIAGDAIADNYHFGSTGNLLAGVDPITGRVYRAVQGVGLSLKNIDRHPKTGLDILGFTIPLWDEVRQHCLLAARSVPMLQWQHWDIALTKDGPVVLELNCEGGVHIVQIGCGFGLNDPQFRTFFAQNHL